MWKLCVCVVSGMEKWQKEKVTKNIFKQELDGARREGDICWKIEPEK